MVSYSSPVPPHKPPSAYLALSLYTEAPDVSFEMLQQQLGCYWVWSL